MTTLSPPRQDERRLEPLSPQDIVGAGLCIGCGACVAQAPPGRAAMRLDAYGQLKPTGDRGWRNTRTPSFARTCPFSPSARNEDALAAARFPTAPHASEWIGRFEAAYVGHVEEGEFRLEGSSGGMVTWTAAQLLREGLVDAVVHVAPPQGRAADEPFFRYQISRSEDDLRRGAQSRYYPIELSGVIQAMRAEPGRYALIGIPCFLKAVHLLCAADAVLRDRVAVTLGLFCGHMKSARMVESFAWQMGVGVKAVEGADFRTKAPDRPANWYQARLRLKDGGERRGDWWNFVDGDWGAGFFQNSACNFCDDVVAETADISFGDAWVEPYSSDPGGTNVVVVRSPLIDRLLRGAIADGRLVLKPVDAAFVHQTQAAGFRQRREGLALRLSRRRWRLRPEKRVAPTAPPLSIRRRLVYLLRGQITAWSHRMFYLARLLRWPALYMRWARAGLDVYQGLAYSRGKVGRIVDGLEARTTRAAAAHGGD